jgi:hypothetical protein
VNLLVRPKDRRDGTEATKGRAQNPCRLIRRHYQPSVDAPSDARRIFGLIQHVVKAAMGAACNAAHRPRAQMGVSRLDPN